uniref:Transposase Tc1-like domain-containing protein n=1 Tax=Salarias fasciatus TaxID=181472 RepID=A0A672FWK5_SALFA
MKGRTQDAHLDTKRDPRVTAKDLKKRLEVVNVSVYRSTFRNTEQAWCPWQDTVEKVTLLSKRKASLHTLRIKLAKEQLYTLQHNWKVF